MTGAWGRWGTQDQRGAANLLTPERVLAALRTASSGRVYSLAIPIRGSGMPLVGGRQAPLHFMTQDGGDYAARGKATGTMVADDFLALCPSTATHVDALAHVWADGLAYNGVDGNTITSQGAQRLGIEHAGPFVTRGVMLDVPRQRGLDALPASSPIDAAELAACALAQRVEIRAGDAVLVRTGWQSAYAAGTGWELREPGITLDAAHWLVERDVCAVGADNAGVEVQPAAEGRGIPVHVELLRNRGIYLFELCALDELARDCVYEFCFIAVPLPIEGGIASPVTPLAIA